MIKKITDLIIVVLSLFIVSSLLTINLMLFAYFANHIGYVTAFFITNFILFVFIIIIIKLIYK